ncbi:MAG TPA: nitroreductase family protein [Candidatus Ozemobacteraceae bacterium]|nr:nitroreductase family protein [Candidatus Ozemobacteraceae bacterium]
MLDFSIDQGRCTGCGACVHDCPARVLELVEGKAGMVAGKAEECIKCQHCLAICPVEAVTIGGVHASDCLKLDGQFPTPEQLELLMRGRRSVRAYKRENLPPELIQRLVEVAWQAPTGVNDRQVLFTVIDDLQTMDRMRQELMGELAKVVRGGTLPERLAMYAKFVELWETKKIDILFRGAPHLIIASAPKDSPCPHEDCLIALSYFELYAHCQNVGTVWDGLAKWAFEALIPGFPHRLGVPKDHKLGYVMAFGRPAVRYPRTGKHAPVLLNRVRTL